MVSDILAEDVKISNLFYSVAGHFPIEFLNGKLFCRELYSVGFLVGPKNIMFSKTEFPKTSFSKQLQKNEIIFIYFPCLPFSMLCLSILHGGIHRTHVHTVYVQS